MKKLIYIVSFVALAFSSGCMDDFLETENLYEANMETFYKTPKQVNVALAGVYNSLYVKDDVGNEMVAINLLSDKMLAGGGPDDQVLHDLDAFENNREDLYKDFWEASYAGIANANALIERLADADYSDYFPTVEEAKQFKNKAFAEAYFMRAYYYFRLAKFFGGVPIMLEFGAPDDVPRASYNETFGQIASDLKMAIELFPDVAFNGEDASHFGHANKWVAQSVLARVYLFYTGYMTNIEKTATSVLPIAGGGEFTKDVVIAHLQECMSESGHDLVGDFRNLWPYAYVNEGAGDDTVLPWAKDENLKWVGQDGHKTNFGTGNLETMFSVRYGFADWGGEWVSNRACLFLGIRDNSLVPFGTGWGMGTIDPGFWNAWDVNDKRREGSILETGNADQGTDGYKPSKDGVQMTSFYNKKYTNIQHKAKEAISDGTKPISGMFAHIYDIKDAHFHLWSAQDFIVMRYADVLLMHSELTETVTGLNMIRTRAGLAELGGYTLEALKKERMYEFAFEGLRWFDLVRWGDVETAYGNTINVINGGQPAVYQVNYRPETKGLLPIPESEIRLSNGVYNQNPGW